MDEPFWIRQMDWLYTLRSVLPGYGGWSTGVTPEGFQILRCPQTCDGKTTLEFVFDQNGEYLESGQNVWQWDEQPIRVRRFWDAWAKVGISDLPHPWVKYWTDPDSTAFSFERDVCSEFLKAGRYMFASGHRWCTLEEDGSVWRP